MLENRLLSSEGLLTRIAKELLELSLDVEMDVHLSDNSLEGGLNRRNGLSSKTGDGRQLEFPSATIKNSRNCRRNL